MTGRGWVRLAWGLVLAVWGAWGTVSAESPSTLIVSPDGPYTSLTAALEAAHNGDTLQVRGGIYPGPLVVNKSVQLIGEGWPTIDGNEQGTVVTLSAPTIRFEGFVVRRSGKEPDRDHAGITLTAPDIIVANNRLEDVLFGVFVAEADRAVVRGNDISSKAEYDLGRRGDGIRLWYSRYVTVEGNYVHGARDVVMWYATGSNVRNNIIVNGRYGLHLMYCDQANITGNRLEHNSVGIYTMYSNQVQLRDNFVRGQRGPSGYAMGFKDSDDVTASGNVLVDNGAAVFLDGAPFSPGGFGRFENNLFAFNDAGVVMLPAVRGNQFLNNTFWENVEQVAISGGSMTGANAWVGNYWSDYTGFDADGDGVGETPYQSTRTFESLTDREPRLRMLQYSPATQAIEMAAQAFPIIQPAPKVVDAAPRLALPPMPAAVSLAPVAATESGRVMPAWLLLGAPAVAGGLIYWWRTRRHLNPAADQAETSVNSMPSPDQPMIVMRDVSKRFGRNQVLQAISLNANAGQALALWGQNGAGKTTLLKAILGLIDFEGSITIAGYDVRRAGKDARRQVGYVPQEVVFYDWRVQTTLEFYARLKRLPRAQAVARSAELIHQLGLDEHVNKAVSALSGGLKQRLALAVALLADPPILLLDEPTANLDAQGRRDYLALLSDLRRSGKTVIFATHRLEELETLADQVALLDQGVLMSLMTPEALRRQLSPQVNLTLWLPEAQRGSAMTWLAQQGLATHLNGRGTVVVKVPTHQKAQVLQALQTEGVSVLDFETE